MYLNSNSGGACLFFIYPICQCLLALVSLHVQLVLDSVNNFVCIMLLVDLNLLSYCWFEFLTLVHGTKRRT
jgi:hypothetical protein